MSEVRGQKTEDRYQRSDVGCLRFGLRSFGAMPREADVVVDR